jgi:hypothetical protein
MTAPGQYRTDFPVALPGGKLGKAPPTPVGVALPGMSKAKKRQIARRKKATGYAYEPVGKPLPKKKDRPKKGQFSDVRGKGSSTSTNKAKQKAYQAMVARELGQQLPTANAAKKAAAKESKLAALARKAGNRSIAVVAGAIGRSLFPGGRTGAKRRAQTAAKVVGALKKVASTKIGQGALIGAAGGAAYALTRKSKLGGRAGDAIVAAYYAMKDRSADARMQAFRNAVRAERAAGTATSARIRELAATFGFSTTGS